MKKLVFILAGLLLSGTTAYATTTTKADLDDNVTRNFVRGYGNSFIFVEQGIEFAVFPDGQFDFNVNTYGPNFSANANFGGVGISFNTGYNYNAYVQYDEFGAIIQIENIPIYYDYYGRVNQVGNVNIFYNNFGYVNRVGGLYVHYNRYNNFSHCSGFINIYNRSYIYRPWHNFYVIPPRNFCVVYNRPYRQFYNPVRYVYNRPFYNNYRPRTAIATRRGNKIYRNRNYATVNRSARNRTQINKRANSRRDIAQANTTRRNNANINRSTRNGNDNIDRRSSSRKNNTSTGRYASRPFLCLASPRPHGPRATTPSK